MFQHGALLVDSLRPRQNGRHFADDIFKCIFLNENVWIPIKISLKFVPKGPINNIPSMVQIMARRRPGDKPLSEPMVASLPTHIFVARHQWVELIIPFANFNGKTVEVWEWKSNFIPHFSGHLITYLYLDSPSQRASISKLWRHHYIWNRPQVYVNGPHRCRQASHYLNLLRPRSISPFDVTRTIWVARSTHP